VGWNPVVLDGHQLQAVVNSVNKRRVLHEAGNFLAWKATVNFSGTNLVHKDRCHFPQLPMFY
jgi:hypothetical protein